MAVARPRGRLRGGCIFEPRPRRVRLAAGIDEEERAEEYMTASAKRRAQEVELVHEMQNDAMEIDAGC